MLQVNKRILVTTTVLGTLTLLLLGALVVPTVLSIRNYRQQISDAHREIETRYALRRHTRDAASNLEEVQQRMRRLPPIAIFEGEELKFINALESAATLADIKQDISLETVNQKEISPWETDIPIHISATGDYRRLIVYLHQIEKLPYLIRVNYLEFGVPRQRELAAQGVVDMRLSGTVRWLSTELPAFRQINKTQPDETLDGGPPETETSPEL